MIVNQYILDFEKMGLGMFVHFGIYSQLGKGEWVKDIHKIPDEEYFPLAKTFCPHLGWAEELAATAADAGCRYITLTTRHHDGYSLYDTCGLNDYDSIHSCGRDLVREFVDACRGHGLIPFFYHTLLDWYAPTFNTDFPAYLAYLRDSVKLLCTRYGKIGGIWFDGKWSRPNDDWEEDALYGMIRALQPEAMIINNTGLQARGALGHIELDSVTFECGRPQPLNMEGAPKYVASEMCQTLGCHWGYAANDLNFKSVKTIIEDLAICRRYGANFLLNVGPKADGSLRPIDRCIFEALGMFTRSCEEALRDPRPTTLEIPGKPKDFVLKKDNTYYLFVHDILTNGDPNVVQRTFGDYHESLPFGKEVTAVHWLDNGECLPFTQEDGILTINTTPFPYGTDLVVRVAKIETK